MKAHELRNKFFRFFRSKGHEIVQSAPMVIKDDPTLMFTNAGMNQFKDIFLGTGNKKFKRVANSQKCLRVSGKHNDLEEVGHDTYHHTMFEMLGNWSFGDYFKGEAIVWAWEFLTSELGIDPGRLYATIFEGSKADKVPRDEEAYSYWQKCFQDSPEKIIEGSKKDNFWEMGDTGPCGPCSEIHIDLRDEDERKKVPGHELVNTGHPLVVEIWNLVFIQYNRKTDGSLEQLPERHVDTGMGFERLCMVIQGKKSNYDTDLFLPVIKEISLITGKEYGINNSWDTAMRVIADHLRAIAFSISDGQLPSNNKAGYVIRRILRRAVRYGYNYLEMEEPFIFRLVPVLISIMGEQYPELESSGEQITTIIHDEETAFLKTLGKGLKMLGKIISDMEKDKNKILPGKIAFELYDTYGFPFDLTRLILKEHGIDTDTEGFDHEMKNQKERSRDDASLDTGDWNIIRETGEVVFTGYETTEDDVIITRYRTVKSKGRETGHLVFDKTPFYAESGGQVGDSGYISSDTEKIRILDTIRENNLIIHITEKIPSVTDTHFRAVVDTERRLMTAANHTATHLLHYALRTVLGKHVEQKGSLVTPDRLRFDFSHFSKPTKEELIEIENVANRFIRENHTMNVIDNISLKEAKSMGAMALFGEKYGDKVRVVKFGDSVELCGGTHVDSTARIGIIKIISEGAIAAGVRRLEAVTAEKAEDYINRKLAYIDEISVLLKNPPDIKESIERLIAENNSLKKNIEKINARNTLALINKLQEKAVIINDIRLISGQVEAENPEVLRSIAFEIRKSSDNTVLVLGSDTGGKAGLVIMISDKLVKEKNINAVSIIKEISPEIKGGGGGQPFLATAGGKNPAGLKNALKKAEEIIKKISA
ncbi:MAG TPA: alanine--tRNA ligase [Bacteroidales bacterium]|nr:alanine--tRNA ligase [Bacteroidales bacterium]